MNSLQDDALQEIQGNFFVDDCLSEITGKGVAAQKEARTNLGLKSLAIKDALTASDVGAVPQADITLGTENLNTVVALGRKFQSLTSNATVARNYPIALAGMLDVIKTTGTGIRQTFYPYNNMDVYHRMLTLLRIRSCSASGESLEVTI